MEEATTMNIDALLWLLVPLILLVVFVALRGLINRGLRGKTRIVAVIIVVALVIVYTIWNLYFR